MPALSLSCRVCATEHPLEAIGTCSRCFGPLDPVYDWDRLRATVTRERLAAGPAVALALRRASPRRGAGGAAPRARASRRSSPHRVSPRRSAWASSGSSSTPPTRRTRSRTASSPSPRGRRRSSVSTTLSCSSTGQPRRRRRRPGGRRGAGGRGLRARRPRAGEARRRGRLRADDLRRGRPLRPLLAALGRAVVRASVGLRQRQPPLVLRGGLEDARVRARRAARLARA